MPHSLAARNSVKGDGLSALLRKASGPERVREVVVGGVTIVYALYAWLLPVEFGHMSLPMRELVIDLNTSALCSKVTTSHGMRSRSLTVALSMRWYSIGGNR